METRLEWDEPKNLKNQRKHGVSFGEAGEAFEDPLHITLKDRIVDGEERWQTFGVVQGVLLLMVAHLIEEEGEADTVIRIISARRATWIDTTRNQDRKETL